jgi:hypothetical protein
MSRVNTTVRDTKFRKILQEKWFVYFAKLSYYNANFDKISQPIFLKFREIKQKIEQNFAK